MTVPRALIAAIVPAIAGACAAQPPMPPGLGVTGVWSGPLVVGGVDQTVTVALHGRADGMLLGYVVGGTSGRAVAAGSQNGSSLALELEFSDPQQDRTVTVSGTVQGNMLSGEASDGGITTPVEWMRIQPELLERRFLFAPASGSDGDGSIVELAVVQTTGSMAFVGGAFVGQTDCGLFACAGAVTSFTETENDLGEEVLQIQLATGGSCPGSGSLEVEFDPSTRFYGGSYSFDDCIGPESGDLLGARWEQTTTRHAAAVLETFDVLATALESGSVIGPAHVPLSADYLHLGEDLSVRLAQFNDEIASHSGIEVNFSRFRGLHTVADPDSPPQFASIFGVDFRDTRTAESGGMAAVYRDVDTTDGADELKFLVESGNDWLVHGNQVSHDLPVAGYTIGTSHVTLPTAGQDVFLSIGPWGAHNVPHTGHVEGNPKADWMALYAREPAQLEELAGDDDGVCETGETCGIGEADLEAGILDYVVPAAPFEVSEVILERLEPAGVYHGTDEHWRVRGRVAYYTYEFVHLRGISAALREAMLDAGYVDPWTVHAPSDNLISGAPVVLEAGQTIGRPQTVAEAIPGHPGFFAGKFGVPETPWQQMEFFTFNEETSRQESWYTWLASSLEAQLAAVLEAEGADPGSFRYQQPFLVERRWKAEMALSNRDSMDRDDYSTLFSALGGWWETTVLPCDGTGPLCDELFSIFPIRKDTAFYDPTLYHSADVSHLAIHAWSDGMPATRFGEVIAPASPDPDAGSLVVRWRNFNGVALGFQGISYRLDSGARILRIAWGALSAVEGGVVIPAVPDDTDFCDGAGLTCHNHEQPES